MIGKAALYDGFYHHYSLRQHTQRRWTSSEDRQEERRHEGAYRHEVSCLRANGSATHICGQARPLPSQGSSSPQGFNAGYG